jgi:hypothetical protein
MVQTTGQHLKRRSLGLIGYDLQQFEAIVDMPLFLFAILVNRDSGLRLSTPRINWLEEGASVNIQSFYRTQGRSEIPHSAASNPGSFPGIRPACSSQPKRRFY